MNPARPLDVRFFSRWENVIKDHISLDATIPLLNQMLDIASGYKHLMIEKLFTERDRLDLATYAGFFDTEIKRIQILGKKAMDAEIQMALT